MSPAPNEPHGSPATADRPADSRPWTDLPTDPRAAGPDTTPRPGPAEGGEGSVAPPGYDVRGELARGGMGVVYAAGDAAFGREVAVKVLLPGWQASRAAVARFGTEARITGRLQHPGIPPVHAAGTLPDGRPFLVMKLVRGRTLAAELEARPDPAADLPRFVQAFEQVCQAVGYAHGEGVIHRDLKPHNVMVGAFGEVQVMDWGLAKDLRTAGPGRTSGARADADPAPDGHGVLPDRPEETASGSVLGTLPYMPPEQARGDVHRVDARSDVFALGGILCAILTGHPPYTGSRAEVVAAAAGGILDGAYARLDRSAADRELVAIASRCLSSDPAGRPADGGAVAALVGAYRTAVEARLQAAERERAAAEARAAGLRAARRWQAVAAGVAGVLVVAGGAVAWTLDRQAAARADAALRRQIVDERREAAERDRAGRNGQGLEALLARADAGLAADDPAAATEALDLARARLPDGGGEHLRPRLARAAADLDALRELDRIDVLRWTSRRGQYQTAEAIAQVPAAALKLGIDLETTPPADAAARLAGSAVQGRLLAAIDLWHVRGRSPAGRAVLRAADPDPYRTRVRDAVGSGDAAAVRALAGEAEALTQPPGFAAVLGQIEAVAADRRAAILRAANRRRPADVTVLMTLGEIAPRGKDGAAERAGWYRAAVAARPGNPSAWNNLGVALRDAGEAAEAAEAFRQATRADPAYPAAAGNLGITLGEAGDVAGAVAAFREATRLAPDWSESWFNLGVGLGYAKDPAGAAAAFATAARLDPTDPRVRFNLGSALDDAGDRAGAIAAYRAAVRLDPGYAKAHDALGLALKAAGDLPAAADAFRRATRLRPDYAPAHYNLGNTLAAANDPAGAAAAYRAAVAVDPGYAAAYANLGFVLTRTGDVAEARAAFREAARLDPARFGALPGTLPPVEVAPPPRPVGPRP